MSGLAAYAFLDLGDEAHNRLNEAILRLSGPNHSPQAHVEAGFGVVVSSRFPHQAGVTCRSEICQAERYVLALEGYVLNLDELEGGSAAGNGFEGRGRRLIALFERFGDDLFVRLNGSYVLVIWDRQERRLTTHSSKGAQRSLFRCPVGEGFVFATEAKTFPILTGRPLELDEAGLGTNMFSGLNHGTETCFKGVRRCFHGSVGHGTPGSYRDTLPRFIPYRTELTTASREEIMDEMDLLLRRSVRRLMPVAPSPAVMMSSGVDSTLVAALVKEIQGEVLTITQGWPGADERELAAAIAEHLGTDHHEVETDFNGEDILEGVQCVTGLLEEPTWGQFVLPLYSFSKSGGDLCPSYLNGLAADVLYGEDEYLTFDDSKREQFNYVKEPWHKDGMPLVLNVPVNDPGDFVRVIEPNLPERRIDRYIYSQLVGHNTRLEICAGSHLAQRIGGESLSVFMDNDVVLHALSIPDSLKFRGKEAKPLLREVLDRYVPRRLIVPGKRGYWAHLGEAGGVLEWVYSQDRLEPVLALLEEKRTLERGLFIRGNMEKLITKYREKRAEAGWHTILWQLASLELFCRQFFDASSD